MQGSSGGVEIAVAGGLGSSTAYMLDGAMHNNPYDNLGLPLPFPDALQEFRVETGALTAGSGVHTGASVNAVTKSGTNLFHVRELARRVEQIVGGVGPAIAVLMIVACAKQRRCCIAGRTCLREHARCH